MSEAEEHLSSTVNYVKEQCNRYTRIDLASETKSLMRIIQSVQQIQNKIYYEIELSPTFEVNEEFLEKCSRDSYVTGIVLLNEKGVIQKQYQADELAVDEVKAIWTQRYFSVLHIFRKKHILHVFPAGTGLI